MNGAEARRILGRRTWPVLPCGLDKRPIRRWKGVEADTYLTEPDAPLWAVPTGREIGAIVLDFDGPVGVTLAEDLDLLPHVITGSGGWHVYASHPGWSVPNSVGKIPGLDIRGDGGIAHIVGRSAKGRYRIIRNLAKSLVPVVALPPAVKALLEPKTYRGGSHVPVETWGGESNGTIGALAALDQACERVRRAVEGTRNATFNQAVYTIAGLVAGGGLDETYAQSQLCAAGLEAGVEDSYVVMRYAWAAGSKVPWKLGPEYVKPEEW